MKNLLFLGTNNVHFTFENNIYQQKDGVTTGFFLGPVFPGIFKVDPERGLLLLLR